MAAQTSLTKPEPTWLPARADLAALLAAGGFPDGPGAWAAIEAAAPGPSGDVALVALRDVVWHPASGLVTTAAGLPLFTPCNQIPDLDRALRAARRARLRTRLERAALWVSPGGLRNYGHFLFDGLTGLAALKARGITPAFPAVAARLSGWQRDLLLAARLRADQLSQTAVEIGQVVYTTCLNSYLNRAGALVPALADRIGRATAGRGAVYLSRRGFSGRIMVNEAALEAALAAQGVTILRPGRMCVADQLAAARDAGVMIGASGAALANALVMAPGASVIELRPAPVREPWMALTTAALDLRHIVLTARPVPAAAAPLAARAKQLPRALTGRYRYCLAADIPAVLAALSAAR